MSDLETSFATNNNDDVNNQCDTYCDVCKVLCNSPFVFQTHLKGQKHAKKRKSLMITDVSPVCAVPSAKRLKSECKVVETDVLQKIHVLANYHDISIKYTTVATTGLDNERFEVKLELGNECYFGKGSSIKRAQQFAACQALKETKYERVTEKMLHQKKKKRKQKKKVLLYPPSKFAESIQCKEVITSDESILSPELCSSVNSRLKELIPSHERINDIERVTAEIEAALETASNDLTEEYANEENDVSVPVEIPFKFGRLPIISFPNDVKSKYRMIQYIARVGNFYKNLLKADENEVNFVLICQRQPTEKFVDELVAMLNSLTDPNDFEVLNERSSVVVKSSKIQLDLRIALTSLLMCRELIDGLQPEQKELLESQCKDPPNMLPIKDCVDALAEIAHASWFHQHLSKLVNAHNAIRLLDDLRSRYPDSMGLMTQWFYEVLVEHSLTHFLMKKLPTYILFRMALELLASGRVLPGSIALCDPCTKNYDSFFEVLTIQQREHLTETAQKFVLLISQGKSSELFQTV